MAKAGEHPHGAGSQGEGAEAATAPSDTGSDAGDALAFGTVGQRLAAARQAAGLDIAEIAQHTRVPQRHLKALEADDHDTLPALPYTQGFVRAFAKAVGLDPEDMAARFRAETSKQPHVPSQIAMAALDERRLPSPGLVVASLVALIAVIGLLSAWGSGAFDADAPDALDGAGIGTELAAPPSAQPASAAAAEPELPPLPLAEGPVVMTARSEVWVRIFDPASGTLAFNGIMQPGQRFEVPSTPPGLRLWTGRAGALAFTLGDRALPPLGGAAEVLKDVSLAPADLIARVSAPDPVSVSSGAPSPVQAPPGAVGPLPVASPPADTQS